MIFKCNLTVNLPHNRTKRKSRLKPERLPSASRGLHWQRFMKFNLFGAVALGILLCGCDTPQQQAKKAENKKTPYNKPLTSLGAKFGALPPPVQATVLAQAGAADIVDAERQIQAGHVVYVVTFREPEIFPTLYVAPDGSVLNPDMSVAITSQHGTKIPMSDVPAPVIKVIDEKGPPSGASGVYKELWGNRTVYIVSFKDEAHYPKMFIAPDGTVLQEGQ